MGVFEDYASLLFEYDLPVIPIKGKVPAILDWQQYCKNLPTENNIIAWSKVHGDCNIGLCLGPACQIVAIDIDTDDEVILEFINSKLPQSPIVKRGAKGETRFYSVADNAHFSSHEIKFNGVHLIDCLYEGRQTVIPPSIHPVTGKPYEWHNGKVIHENLDDLPDLHPDTLTKFKVELEAFAKRIGLRSDTQDGRNNYLKRYACALYNEKSESEAAYMVYRRDIEKHGEAALFSDKAEFRYYKKPLDNALKFVRSVYKSVNSKRESRGQKPVDNEDKVTSYDVYKEFFDRQLPNAKKDLLSDTMMFKIKPDRDWTPVENYLGKLRSRALSEGLTKTHVADHLDEWISERDPQLLIDIPKWDGEDRILQMMKSFKIKNISHAAAVELAKDWYATVFRRLYNPQEQNKLLLLQGNQGIGKDTWIRSFCGAFESYHSEIPISEREKDNYERCGNTIVANISEFDKYAKIHPSIIKNLITISNAQFREAYARRSKLHHFRTSFISSCNTIDILRDPTGNRRFIIIELSELNWDFKTINSKQILAQGYALYRDDFRANDTALKEMANYLEAKKPEDINETVIEMFDERISALGIFNQSREFYTYRELSPIIEDLCRACGLKWQRVSNILRLAGRKKKIGGKTRFYSSAKVNASSLEDNILRLDKKDT